MADSGLRPLDAPASAAQFAHPASRRASLPFSTSAKSLVEALAAPVPGLPSSQWHHVGQLPSFASSPSRSRLRASAPPFQSRSPSSAAPGFTGCGGSSSNPRFPSASFPVLPSQLSSHEAQWSGSDTRKIGLDGGSHGPSSASSSPLHSFVVPASTMLRVPPSPAARRPVTPSSQSSTLSSFSAPFTPSSAPTQSRSLRDVHSSQQLQATPTTPHSSLHYSPLLGDSTTPQSMSEDYSAVEDALHALIPQLPFDVPSDRDFLHEQPSHALYMFAFRTSVCPLYRAGSCPNDAYSCFYAHAKLPRRRSPLLHHGRYNYIPTRCRYLLEDRECPKGPQCRFAHVTEEVIYHPSKYKTQLCSHPTDERGCCTGYGLHCAKAHSEEDRRQPVYEVEEGQPRRWTADHLYEFQCPPSEREQERLYYLYRYKTQRCAGFPFNCQCDGLDWHREEERRRGPAIRYAPMACPNVKPYINAEWGDPSVDCSGKYAALNAAHGRVVQWDCDYAHTLLELMYHPQVFKTHLCVAAGSVVTMGCGGGLEVERVRVGDVVMAWDADKGGLVRTEVLGVIEREEERECVELTFEDGRSLRCTPDHRLLVADGEWREAQQLAVGESRVQSTSVPSLLLSSCGRDRDGGGQWTLRLCGDDRYDFSCADRSSCLRLCAVARIIGLSVVATLSVTGDEEDEAQWQCCVRRESQLDAERLAADVELVSGEEVEWRREDDGFVIVLPPSLVAALHPCDSAHVPPGGFTPVRLPPLLTDAATPQRVYKECIAAMFGALPAAEAGVDSATGHPHIRFTLPATREPVLDAVHSVVNSVRQRFDIDLQCHAVPDSADRQQCLIFSHTAMQRTGVRYNARLEVELARAGSVVAAAAALDTHTAEGKGATSADAPCYSLSLVSRRPCGPRRVFDVQVDSRLHSFVADGLCVHNCDHFRQNDPHSWKCVWKRRCAHAHGHADLKSKEQAVEGWRRHLALIGQTSAGEENGRAQQRQHPSPLSLPRAQRGEEAGKTEGESSGRSVLRPLLSRWREDVADANAWAGQKLQASGERERRGSMPLLGTKSWVDGSPVSDKLSTYSPYSDNQQQSASSRVCQHKSPRGTST